MSYKERDSELPNPYELALRRLERREYSAFELKTYLRRKKCDEQEIDAAIEKLQRLKFIDDSRYSRIVARNQVQRGKGPRYVRQKLQQKGIKLDGSQASELFSEISERSELELARQVLLARYPHYRSDLKERSRAYQALLRRGFSFDVASKALAMESDADPL